MARWKLVLLESDPELRHAMVRLLRRKGYPHVVGVGSDTEALQQMRGRKPPACLAVDVHGIPARFFSCLPQSVRAGIAVLLLEAWRGTRRDAPDATSIFHPDSFLAAIERARRRMLGAPPEPQHA